MAITKKQLIEKQQKINTKCANGFKWDWQSFVWHKENKLQKVISLSKTKQIVALLCFQEEYDRKTGKSTNIPQLNVYVETLAHDDQDSEYQLWGHSGFGETKKFSDRISRTKTVKILQEISEEITDELIYTMAGQAKDVSFCGTIIESLPENELINTKNESDE